MSDVLTAVNKIATEYLSLTTILTLLSLIIAVYGAVIATKAYRGTQRERLDIKVSDPLTVCAIHETTGTLEDNNTTCYTGISLFISVRNKSGTHIYIDGARLTYRTDNLKWESLKISDADSWYRRVIKRIIRRLFDKTWEKHTHLQDRFRLWHRFYKWFDTSNIYLHGFYRQWERQASDKKIIRSPLFFQPSLGRSDVSKVGITKESIRIESKEKKSGLVYFESSGYYGGYRPLIRRGKVRVKLTPLDSSEHQHAVRLKLPIIDLPKARTYHPHFGSMGRQPEKVMFS